MGVPVRLLTVDRVSAWHVWATPNGEQLQTECGIDEYRRCGSENFQPKPPDTTWVWLHSYEGPVLSSGKQYLEPGDIFLDQQDYLACVQLTAGLKPVDLAVPIEAVSIAAVTNDITLDTPRFYVQNGMMEVKQS